MDPTPTENLFRGRLRGLELREQTEDTATDEAVLEGHFAVFDQWTEIHSWFEGNFLERIAPGAFAKTIKEQRDQIVVQFDHGYDFHVGDAPLGPVDELREDDVGLWAEVPLLDTDYNRDRLVPLLRGSTIGGEDRGSLLGASFRFRAVKDEWDRAPKKSAHNPEALPERTIREVRLFEFGPVVFPAYAGTSIGMRSLTDHFLERRRERRSHHLDGPAAGPPATAPAAPTEPPTRHSEGTPARRLSVAAARTQLLSLPKEA